MSTELEHIWSRVQDELALAVDEPTYRIWLAPLRPVEVAGEQLLIEVHAHSDERRTSWELYGKLHGYAACLARGQVRVVRHDLPEDESAERER